MIVCIKELASGKIDNLICQDMDSFAKAVPSPSDSDTVDITVNSVSSVVVCPETITFIFENLHMFCAHIPVEYYYKIEVI